MCDIYGGDESQQWGKKKNPKNAKKRSSKIKGFLICLLLSVSVHKTHVNVSFSAAASLESSSPEVIGYRTSAVVIC